MRMTIAGLCAASMLGAGCATRQDPPLIFGAAHVYGVSIGANAADAGGEFVVGYKGADVAVIPVSAVQSGGGEELVGAAYGTSHRDSYSVLGQFGGSATKTKTGANAGLGKFFATGTAAQNIAHGYAMKMGADRSTTVGCVPDKPKDPQTPNADEVNRKLDFLLAGLRSQALAQQRLEDQVMRSATRASEGPRQATAANSGASLYFAQYDYFALAVDGSAADTGVKLTLGYKDRNLAVVPVLGRDAQGNLTRLGSQDPGSGEDAYSVLGQFESTNGTDANGSNSSLNSFFSTGAASRILSNGFKIKLCDEYQATGAK